MATGIQAAKISSNQASSRTLFGHPIGLFVLFFTEMWERFSYYGMRALLVLYLVKHLIVMAEAQGSVIGFIGLKSALEGVFGPLGVQPLSSQIYGLYTAFAYFTPMFGGIIADRYIGHKMAVIIGGLLMAVGHFLMAFETWFLVALLFLIAGNGMFKPNISTQVGALYPAGDPRRDGAFVIFYMGINVGAFLSPLICGTLGQIYGWHWGFGAAGVGMVIGVLVYIFGQPFLAHDEAPAKTMAQKQSQPLTSSDWKAIFGLGALCFLNIFFWGVYEQQGNTVQLFADKSTDWHIFGWEMPSTWFQAMNPMFIVLLGPVLNAFWLKQNRAGKEPNSISKMAIGCLVLGLAFPILVWLCTDLAPDQKISFLWLLLVTFIYTLGELYLSPIGLSLVTKVAPAKVAGLMMGVWFLSSFFGNYLSGYLGAFYTDMGNVKFFWMLTFVAVAASFAIFALKKPMQKMIGNDL